jgi:hypothetical protein
MPREANVRVVALAALVITLLTGSASSQPGGNYFNGTLQEEIACAGANCTSTCVGPGGSQKITDYTQIQAFMLSQPDRLWLKVTSTSAAGGFYVIVLGVGDRCTFGGLADDLKPAPGGSSPIGNYQPARICIGQQCF